MAISYIINRVLIGLITLFEYCLNLIKTYFKSLKQAPYFCRSKRRSDHRSLPDPACIHRHINRKKPDWVIKQVIQIKAFHSQAGCRAIATIFNSRFENHKITPETISKSFVANTIKNHLYDIQIIRRNIKSKPAHAIPFNKVWGIDLTFINEKPILGVIEHNSRKCLSLVTLKDKTSITILRKLLDILEHHPKPQFIRSDNEVCFNSKLIKFCLWFLGIKKQTIDKHSPWQNGRIERFFGTLKSTIKSLPESFTDETELPYLLHSFEWWYNEIRLHQNLGGKTPASIHTNRIRKYQQRE
jgi:putative transposase